MSLSTPTGGLNGATAQWLSNNLHRIESLPHPSETWCAADDHGIEWQLIDHLKSMGVVKKLDRRMCSEWGDYVNYYRTSWIAYQRIEELKERRADETRMLPCTDENCPGNGFTNLGGGKVQCNRDGCGEVHDKSEVRL